MTDPDWRDMLRRLHRDATDALIDVVEVVIDFQQRSGRRPLGVRWNTEVIEDDLYMHRTKIVGFMLVFHDSVDDFDTEGYCVRSRALWTIDN
jgi:hypothetical protein